MILTDLIDHWPARQTWSFESFSQLGADVEVYLEVGNVMQGAANFVPVKFGDYIRSILDSCQKDASQEIEPSERPVPYLSIFDIFHFFPQLKSDVDFSLLRSQKVLNYSAAFLGPRGTVTGLHFDWADNTLAQIRGHKAITLVSPDQSPPFTAGEVRSAGGLKLGRYRPLRSRALSAVRARKAAAGHLARRRDVVHPARLVAPHPLALTLDYR